MKDIYDRMRKDVNSLTIGAFTSRAYDGAVRRATHAGVSPLGASQFGKAHYAKALKLYAKLTSK